MARKIFLILLSLTILTGCTDSSNNKNNNSNSFLDKFINKSKVLKSDDYNYDISYFKSEVTPNTSCVSDDKVCYGGKLLYTLNSQGLDSAINLLSSLPQNLCNNMSSSFGSYLISNKVTDIAVAKQDPKFCGDSFTQGVVFTKLSKGGSEEELVKICDNLPKDSRWNCSIYIGQYFLSKNIKDPIKVSEICYMIPSPDDSKGNHMTFRRACLSGVWQRFFNNESVVKLLDSLNPSHSDIFSFCLNSQKSSKEVCLQEDSNVFFKIDKFKDINTLFKACRELRDKELTDQCNFGMGRGVADNMGRDPNKLFLDCSKLTLPFDFEYCMIAAGEALDRVETEKLKDSLCPLKNTKCLIGMGTALYGMYSGSEKDAIDACNRFYTGDKENNLCILGVFRGLSRLSYIHSDPQVVDEIFARCDSYSGKLLSHCIVGVFAGSLHSLDKIGGYSSLKKYCESSKFLPLCSLSIVSTLVYENENISKDSCNYSVKVASTQCTSGLGIYLSLFDLEENCSYLDSKFTSLCTRPDENVLTREYSI